MKKIIILLCFTLFSLGVNAQFIIQSPTVTSLTSGRVIALLDLASVTHINTDPGTKIPFTGTIYTNGMTTNSGSITPSQTAKYRADWLCMSPSTEFLADGIFHVVQNGVSVGQVSYNMNEASAVNQCAGFIDVDLIAGQEVSLHYRTRHTTTDGIGWDRGSYFQLTQLPSAVAPIIDLLAQNSVHTGITNNSTFSGAATSDIAGSSFTIPAAGTWLVTYELTLANGTTGQGTGVGLFDDNNIYQAESWKYYENPSAGYEFPISSTCKVITSGSKTFKLRGTTTNSSVATVLNNTLNNNGGVSKITYVQITGGLPTNIIDNTASGYFDIGNMRMQWGTTANVANGTIVTLPVPFANTNYSLSGVVTNNITALFNTFTITTTTFTANLWNTNGGGATSGIVKWFAIGSKP